MGLCPMQRNTILIIFCPMPRKRLIYIVILIVLVLFASFIFYRTRLSGPASTKSNVFSAVFLLNDQVYFGQITKETDNEIVLRNVYYLKANATVDTQSSEENAANVKLSLVKLGDELHNPEDWMIINRDHVLFIERLRPQGTIMDAIRKYQKEE